MIYTILASVALAASLIAVAISVSAYSHARKCFDYVRQVSQMRPGFDELATLSTELTSQKDALVQISKGLRTIRNRMNVRETNAKRKLDQEKTADESDDEKWLRETNAALQTGQLRTGE